MGRKYRIDKIRTDFERWYRPPVEIPNFLGVPLDEMCVKELEALRELILAREGHTLDEVTDATLMTLQSFVETHRRRTVWH